MDNKKELTVNQIILLARQGAKRFDYARAKATSYEMVMEQIGLRFRRMIEGALEGINRLLETLLSLTESIFRNQNYSFLEFKSSVHNQINLITLKMSSNRSDDDFQLV